MTLTTPGWLTWYTKNDQYSKQKLQARPRGAAQLLPEPRLPRVQRSSRRRCRSRRTRRTSTSRSTSPRGRATRSATCGSPATSRSTEPELRGADPRASRARRSRASGCRRSAKDISDRLGAEGYAFANVNAVPEIDRDEEHRGVHDLRRPGPPRLRAQDQHQRQPEDARRGDPPRDAPARGRVVRRPAHRALEGAHAAARLLRATSTSRRRRCRARPTRSTSRSRSPRSSTGNLLAGVGYSSADGVVFNALGVAAEHLRLRQRAGARRSTRAGSTAPISLTYTEPYWTVDGVSRTLEVYQREHSTRRRSSIAQYSSDDDRRRGRLRRPDHRNRHDQLRLPLRAHRSSTLFADSPPVYYRLRRRVRRRRPTAYIVSAGWARDTRDDILYPTQRPAAERAGRSRACRSATSRTTRRSTCISGSGRSMATSC